jgi:ABC-type bacteriocin/lantibiotic exporter with double-glycine peptidase domain
MPLLDFPEARQATGFDCGAAAIQALLFYYGVEAREDYLVEALGSKDEGTVPTRIVSFLRDDLGFKAHAARMTVPEVKIWIDQKVPVVVLIQAWKDWVENLNDEPPPPRDYKDDWEDGHYVVIIGYDGDGFIIEDPSLPDNRGRLSYAEMDDRWHDRDKLGRPWRHFGLVVLDRKPQYDSSEIFHIRAARRLASRWLARSVSR